MGKPKKNAVKQLKTNVQCLGTYHEVTIQKSKTIQDLIDEVLRRSQKSIESKLLNSQPMDSEAGQKLKFGLFDDHENFQLNPEYQIKDLIWKDQYFVLKVITEDIFKKISEQLMPVKTKRRHRQSEVFVLNDEPVNKLQDIVVKKYSNSNICLEQNKDDNIIKPQISQQGTQIIQKGKKMLQTHVSTENLQQNKKNSQKTLKKQNSLNSISNAEILQMLQFEKEQFGLQKFYSVENLQNSNNFKYQQNQAKNQQFQSNMHNSNQSLNSQNSNKNKNLQSENCSQGMKLSHKLSFIEVLDFEMKNLAIEEDQEEEKSNTTSQKTSRSQSLEKKQNQQQNAHKNYFKVQKIQTLQDITQKEPIQRTQSKSKKGKKQKNKTKNNKNNKNSSQDSKSTKPENTQQKQKNQEQQTKNGSDNIPMISENSSDIIIIDKDEILSPQKVKQKAKEEDFNNKNNSNFNSQSFEKVYASNNLSRNEKSFDGGLKTSNFKIIENSDKIDKIEDNDNDEVDDWYEIAKDL